MEISGIEDYLEIKVLSLVPLCNQRELTTDLSHDLSL